jgi:hypothetical protein
MRSVSGSRLFANNGSQLDQKLLIRIRDPVPFLPLDPGSGMGKKSKSGSGMNNPDHIAESLETIFCVKYLNSLMLIRDLGWKKFGFGINIPDPQP